MENIEQHEDPISTVHQVSLEHRGTWAEKSEEYWMARLMQEVGELATALVDPKPGDDDPDHELAQIVSIAINWMYLRKYRKELE